MLLIYLPEITSRHQYVFNHIFGYLGIDYNFTINREEFIACDKEKFSYAATAVNSELHFSACGLLNESSITQFVPQIGEHLGIKTLFRHNASAAALPYDVFSAVFYMLSRYEEYLPFEPDQHGRFEATNSLAYKHQFLYSPVVDHWIVQLAAALLKHFPTLKIKKHQYEFIPTYDIDMAFSYKHKGFKRTMGGLVRDCFGFKCGDYFSRMAVLLHIKPDPFDSYDYQFALQEKFALEPIYFFHAGTYGKFDKNISPEQKPITKLIQRIAANARLGMHPSYLSAEKPELLSAEIKRMEQACGQKIRAARQHFIKIRFPETYTNYIANGITDDYSMGYATDIGFRAGTSQPYLFFDLAKNCATPLKVHPFAFMEGVFKHYKPVPTNQIIGQITPLIQQIKALDGTFISLWHNESLGTSAHWEGWRTIYETMIVAAQQNNS
ncbi:MAG: polysaccharide deacetylase family protein [Bacteroidota bacterium]